MTPRALRLAAALADTGPPSPGSIPAPEGGPAAEEADAEAVVDVLRAGKVPLAELDGAAPRSAAALLVAPAWREAAGRERRERDDFGREFEPVAAALEGAGIEAVLFKAARGLPYRSSNLDLLVRPGRMGEAAGVLESLGHLRLPHYREPRKLLYRRFRAGRSVLCVHLHEAVSWGRILILDGGAVVDRSRPSPEGRFRIASAEDLILITLAHALYENDGIRLSDLRALRLAACAPGISWSCVQARARDHGWAAGLAAMLGLAVEMERALLGASRVPDSVQREADAELQTRRLAFGYVTRTRERLRRDGVASLPLCLSRWWTKSEYLARLLAAPDRAPDERLADLAATAGNLLANRLKLRCRPASIVSLSGLDGAGKSAAVAAVRDALVLCEVPARVVWSRGGFGAALSAIKRAARGLPLSGIPAAGDERAKRRWLRGRTRGVLFAAAVLAEQAVGQRLRIALPRRLGLTIVCDRSGHDLAADLQAKLGPARRLSRWAARLAVACAPAADLALLLRVPSAEAARRKPGEVPIPMLAAQERVFDDLARGRRLRAVDAARSEEEVVGEVVDRALRVVFARFRCARPPRTHP